MSNDKAPNFKRTGIKIAVKPDGSIEGKVNDYRGNQIADIKATEGRLRIIEKNLNDKGETVKVTHKAYRAQGGIDDFYHEDIKFSARKILPRKIDGKKELETRRKLRAKLKEAIKRGG